MRARSRRSLGGAAAAVLLATAALAGCGDTDAPESPGGPASEADPTTSSSIDTYNDVDNDGKAPGGDSHEGEDNDANPDAEETDR